MLDRIVILGAGFATHKDLQAVDPARLECISRAIVAVGEGHLERIKNILGDARTPLSDELDHIEQTLRHGAESMETVESEPSQAPPTSRWWKPRPKRLLLPDAFTNVDYFMYALKLSVCATMCYVIYNGLGWPGISTAFFTVYFTGLSTTGASNRKLVFRVIGSTIGGLILGIGCMVFVFPNIEWVTSFLLVIAALAFLGGWISASPYFGYIGLQIAFSFNLIAFERLRAPEQMTPARDRLLGIALGFIVMFFIFHQVRPERTVDTMRRLLARLLRAAADLVSLLDMEPKATRDEKIAAMRKQIETVVVNLRTFADVVKFEFPPDRAASMRLSDEIMSAVTSAEDVVLGVPTWPKKLDGEQQAAQLKEIRNALVNGLRQMALLLEQLPPEQQTAPESTLEKLCSSLPVSIARTIDSYRELKMVCAYILRAAA
ncbi:MAG TPA: FUSC family protein [Terriglobales bacterium]|nr:FUSC family protein [Terriglobales bacterium]